MPTIYSQSGDISSSSGQSYQIEFMKRCGKFLDNMVALVKSY